MYLGKRIIAIVPARGGSKGIPLKNLREVGGRSLVRRVGDVLAALPEIDRAVVSTDHEEIADQAVDVGIEAPFYRPESLSGDSVADWDVLVHALAASEEMYREKFDIVVMLQPTSPLRQPGDVRRAIYTLVSGDYDAVWTVSEVDSKHHPLKQLTLRNENLSYYDQAGEKIIARQQLSTTLQRNGVAYAISRDCLLEKKSIKGVNTGAVKVVTPQISIDSELDLWLADAILNAPPNV